MDPNIVAKGAKTFSDLDPKMQLSTMMVFLFIAQRGITNQQDVEIALGLTTSAVSRNVAYWTTEKFDRTPGMDMMERFEDPKDRRSKLLRLNAKGKRFYDKLKEAGNAKATS